MADDNSIDIKVTATTADLESGLSKATGEVKDFGAEINNLAERVAAVKPDAFKELAEQFNAGKLDLDEFRDGLMATSAASSAAATEAKALAEGTALSSGAMRELVVVGRELASGNLTRLPGSLALLAQRLGGIPPQAILVAGAIGAMTFAIYEFVESSERFDSDLEKIQNAFTAVGSGNQFDRTQITQYIDDLRQIPGVTEDMATAAINNFSRVQNGTRLLGETTRDLQPFADLIGVKVPEAAKVLAAALNEPIKGVQDLRKYGVELSAAQEEQIRQMMAVNDVAGAQRVLLDGISTAVMGIVDTSTPLESFWTNLRNGLLGVSEQAIQTRERLLDVANTASDPNVAAAARIWAGVEGAKSRNVPNADWSGSSGTMAAGAQKQQQEDRAAQQRQLNDAIHDGNELADRSNSPLIEQQKHIETITRLQNDLNAAIKQSVDGMTAADRASGANAAPRIQSAIDQENENYQKKQDKRAPAFDTTDNDFQALINQEAEKGLRDQQQQDQARIESDAKVGEAKLKTAEDTAKQQYALGQVTAEQEQAQLLALANQSNAIEQARFDQLATLYKNDAAKYTELMAQKQQAEQKFQEQVQQIDATAAQRKAALEQKEQQQFDQSVQKMIGPWESALSNMGTRTNVWAQAVIQSQRMIESNLVSGVARMAANWLLGENEKSAATAIGAKFRELTQSQGSSEAVQQNIQNTETNQSTDAVGVFTNVFNYLSPELGPFAAAPAAAASAAVLALSLPSAAGGWVVPNDTLAMVHENEMILPAHLSQGIGSMIANGQSGGGTTNHFNVNVAAHGRLNAGDLDGLHDAVVGSMRKAARNGQLGGMR